MLNENQLDARKLGLGGSDMVIVVGLSSWMTPLDLFYQKQGAIERPARSDSDDLSAWLGHRIEPVLADWYTENIEQKVRRVNRTRTHPEFDWWIANPDRLIVGAECGLEFKMRANPRPWGRTETDEVPDDVRTQCNWYMGAYGYHTWEVVVFLPPFDIRHYILQRDDELIEGLQIIGQDFWSRVINNDPPDPDWEHSTTYDLLTRMYPAADAEPIKLPDECDLWHEVWMKAKEHRRHYESVEAGARNHILEAMNYHTMGFLGDGSTYHRRVDINGNLKRFWHSRAKS